MPQPVNPVRTLRRPRAVALLVAVIAGVAVAAWAGLAVARSFTLAVAKNAKVTNMIAHTSKHEAIVVDTRGVALYTLSGESGHHLLCTSSTCFGFWPPFKVGSGHAKLAKAAGVKGKLGILHRNGFFQVTLGGHPLYRFHPDGGKKAVATGEGIVSFGGTWHVVKASSSANSPSPASTPTTTPTQPTPGY